MELFCPYTVNSEQYSQHEYEYDESGQMVKDTSKLIEKRPFVKCAKEKCAAWHDGKCCYVGAVN